MPKLDWTTVVRTGRQSVPSPAEVEQARSPGGGWTKRTLQDWGVAWPPPSGWRERLRVVWEMDQVMRLEDLH